MTKVPYMYLDTVLYIDNEKEKNEWSTSLTPISNRKVSKKTVTTTKNV